MKFYMASLNTKAPRDPFYDEKKTLVMEPLNEGLGLCEAWNVDVERNSRQEKVTYLVKS